MKIQLRAKSSKRLFFASAVISLILIVFVSAMMVADYRCRSTALGDKVPPLKVERGEDGSAVLEVHSMGVDTEFDVTAGAKLWDFVREFVCIPVP